MSARTRLRLTAGWHHAGAAALALLALHLAVADAPVAADDTVLGSDNLPWLSPGLRWPAASAFGVHHAGNEVRWQRQGESSQWFARVSIAPLPTPALQGEAQWSTRAGGEHELRLGLQAQQALLPQAQGQGATLGVYVHQEVALADDWRVALGVRGDGAANADVALTPRAALSWQARPGLQLRWVEGAVWRDVALAPQPWVVGPTPSPMPSAVRLQARELALNWQAGVGLRLAASLHRQRDAQAAAAIVPGTSATGLRFQHMGTAAAGDGLGLEGDCTAGAWRLRARWAAFAADDDRSDEAMRLLAAVQAQTSLPWRGASAGLEWLRLELRGNATAWTQTLVNATLAWSPVGTPWTVAANAYNLADHALPEGIAAQDLLVREGRRWQVQVTRVF